MLGDFVPEHTIKLFQKTALSSVSEVDVERKVIEAVVKKDLDKLNFPETSSETTTELGSGGKHIQINSKELELDRTYAVFAKHVNETPLVTQTQTTETSSIGLVNNADLTKNINVNEESSSFYNSTAKFIFTDGGNVFDSETGNLRVTLNDSVSDEYNAFKAVNHRRSRLGVSGEEVDGLRVREATEFNEEAAYLSEKLILRDNTNGKLSVNDHVGGDLNQVTFNNDGYVLEIPTDVDVWKPVIEGAVKVIQDDPTIDVVLTSEPSGDVTTLAISKENEANLATSLTRAQFDQYFTPEVLLNVGNRYKVEVSSHVGGGYSNDGFRGFSVDDSDIARNLDYMNYCQNDGNDFDDAVHTVEITNGDLTIVAVDPSNNNSLLNMNLMSLSDEDEYLNGSQHDTDGSVKIQLTSHHPAESDPALTRWEFTSEGSSSLKGLEVTYHRINEWSPEGYEEVKADLALKYKENAFVEFTPTILVTNTRNTFFDDSGNAINGTYERFDLSANNLPIESLINEEIHFNNAHVGKSENMAAVIANNGNSVLVGTDITFNAESDVFSEYDDKLVMIQVRRERNLVDESELYSEQSGNIVNVRTDIVARNIDLAKLYDVSGTLFNARDMRLRLTTKQPEDLNASFTNCEECSLVVTNYKVTDPSNVNYEPNLLTVKEQVGATIMGSNANRILAKGDDYDLKIHVRLFTTDQTKADYVRNNVTMEYSLVDGSDNVVDELTGLYDLIEEELVDDEPPAVVTSPETEVTSGIVWATSAIASQYKLKVKTITSTRRVLIPFKFGAYNNLWIKTPEIDMIDTRYTVYDKNTNKAKPDSYLSYVKFVDGSGVQSDITFTRRFTSAGFPGVVNSDEINEVIVFKPSALAGFKGVLEVNTGNTPAGPWVPASVSGQHVDIAQDTPSNLTVYSLDSATQSIVFNGDVTVDYVMGKYVDGDYLLEMSTPNASSNVESFSIVTRTYEVGADLDLDNWDGVYSNEFPLTEVYEELSSRISVSYEDADSNQNTQPIVHLDVYVNTGEGEVLLGRLSAPETFIADVNIVRSFGTIVKSSERLGTTDADAEVVNVYYWNTPVASPLVFSDLVSLGSNHEGTNQNSGVLLWMNRTAQRGDTNVFRLRGDRVKVIMYNGTPVYSGVLSGDDSELTYETGLVAGDELSRKLSFTYYRGYHGYATTATYDEFVLDRTVTTIQMKVALPSYTFTQELSDLYVGSNHIVSNLVDASNVMGNLNLKFDGERSMFSTDTNMTVPILLTFATFDLKITNPLDESYNVDIVGESAASFRGKTYENNNSILPARIIVYNEEYYSIQYNVPDLRLFHSTLFQGDIRTGGLGIWTPYPSSENLSDDILRETDTYLKEKPSLLNSSVVRLQRIRINVQPHTKFFVAPPLQMLLEAVGRDQVSDITYDASVVTRRDVYGDCVSCNTEGAYVRFNENVNSSDFTAKQLNDITLVQYTDFKSPASVRLTPDSTWRYFNIRSNKLRIELYLGLYPDQFDFVPSSSLTGPYTGAIYDGFIDELDLSGNQTTYLNVNFTSADSKFQITTSQSLAPFIPNLDLAQLIEDDLPFGTLNLIWDGFMPHMRGILYLNNYAGDSAAWGLIGNQVIKQANGQLVYRMVKYETDFGANLDNYLTTSVNRNLMIYAQKRYTLDITVPLQTLAESTPYNMVEVVSNLDFSDLSVNWIEDLSFNPTQLDFGFNPLSIEGRNQLRTFFSVQVNKGYQLMLIEEPDVYTVRKYDGTEIARLTGQGFMMSHGVVITPWNFMAFHNA
jgi:hypothetical protein